MGDEISTIGLNFNNLDNQTKGEYLLAVVRILIGWLFLWPFFDKLLGLGFETPSGSGLIDNVSPSSFVTYVTSGFLKDFYLSLGGNIFVDGLLMFALLALGIALVLGFASKLSVIGSVLFLIVMYSLQIPPESNPLIDFRIVFAVTIVQIYYLKGFDKLSISHFWNELWFVKKYKILE